MKHLSLSVVLGRTGIRAFVAAPKEIRLLGMVRMGMEFGLLGLDSNGRYVRVNGSLIRDLNGRQVEQAIYAARNNYHGGNRANFRHNA
jgi:hypothetical protein